MSSYSQVGIELGKTASGNIDEAITTIVSTDHRAWAGYDCEVPGINRTTTGPNVNKLVPMGGRRAVLCRNMVSGGIASAAGKCVNLVWASRNGVWLPEIDGLSTAADQHVYPLDELLTGGVAQYDLCWVITSGTAKCMAGDAGFTTLTYLKPGASDVGELVDVATTGLDTPNEIFDVVGMALETKTDGLLGVCLILPRVMAH